MAYGCSPRGDLSLPKSKLTESRVKAAFCVAILLPFACISIAAMYFFFFTSLPQQLYLSSIRNIYFNCTEFVPDDFVYKMKPGKCELANIEYDTTLTHDRDGFRNSRTSSSYDVVAIGASHTHGFGVEDDQTFASILQSKYGYLTRNLGIGAYATVRELNVLAKYGGNAKYVVMQFCSNDIAENSASLALTGDQFRAQVEAGWKRRIETYERGKRLGLRKPLHDMFAMVASGSFQLRSAWQQSAVARNLEPEALAFAEIIGRHRHLLQGKRLIIFESSDFGFNSPAFKTVFASHLDKLEWLSYDLVDTTKVLASSDYYSLDGHPTPRGHAKLAVALAEVIDRWEAREPIIEKESASPKR